MTITADTTYVTADGLYTLPGSAGTGTFRITADGFSYGDSQYTSNLLPNFIGMKYLATEWIIAQNDWRTIVQREQVSQIQPLETVLNQYPPAGTTVNPETVITLVIATPAHALGATFNWLPLF